SPQPYGQPTIPAFEFDVQSPKVDIAELDRLLNPHYRPAPFFGISGGDPAAQFFANLSAGGVVEAAVLSYGDSAMNNFKGSMIFHDRTLDVNNFSGEFAGGTQNGHAAITFATGIPVFNIETGFSGVDLSQLTRAANTWSGTFSGRIGGVL